MKRIFLNGVLVVGGFIFALLLLEVGLRMFAPQRDLPSVMYLQDETLGHIYAAGWHGKLRTAEFVSKTVWNVSIWPRRCQRT